MADTPDLPEHADPARYVELVGFEGDWREQWWNPDFLGLVAARLRFDEVGEVLDVGCGAGHWGRTLLPHLPATTKITGIDREAEFLRLAETTATEREITDRCSYRTSTAEKLPFDDDTFDLATCQTLLIHVPDAAAVVREMSRVVRPGGLVLVAEPDNFATTLAMINTTPATPDDEIIALLQFQQVCHRGKFALGEGDEMVGGKLPGLLARLGLEDVRVYNNDKCAALVPPYDAPGQRIDLAEHLRFREQGAWFTGTRGDSARLYAAGGGDASNFDEVWAMTERWWDRFAASTGDGTFHATRGMLHYLGSGRVPV
jgi:SAM-dependent methyltransferase